MNGIVVKTLFELWQRRKENYEKWFNHREVKCSDVVTIKLEISYKQRWLITRAARACSWTNYIKFVYINPLIYTLSSKRPNGSVLRVLHKRIKIKAKKWM